MDHSIMASNTTTSAMPGTTISITTARAGGSYSSATRKAPSFSSASFKKRLTASLSRPEWYPRF